MCEPYASSQGFSGAHPTQPVQRTYGAISCTWWTRGRPLVSLNAAITGLRFFFDVTADHPELIPVRVPRTLPVILSREEVSRLIIAAGNLKHQTALALAYATGLRVSEVVALKVGDIDSERMTLRVEQGKGQKDRYAMLAPVLLERLRVWWRVARAQGKMPDGGWLSPCARLLVGCSFEQMMSDS